MLKFLDYYSLADLFCFWPFSSWRII